MSRFDPEPESAPVVERVKSVLEGATPIELDDVTIPRTTVVGRMRLVTRTEAMAIKAQLTAEFSRKGLLSSTGQVFDVAAEDWRLELCARTMAAAVMDPVDPTNPLAPVEDWRALDDDQLSAVLDAYSDLRDRLDPLGEQAVLSESEVLMLRAASKKKDAAILRSFGLHRLVSFVITTADQPAS